MRGCQKGGLSRSRSRVARPSGFVGANQIRSNKATPATQTPRPGSLSSAIDRLKGLRSRLNGCQRPNSDRSSANKNKEQQQQNRTKHPQQTRSFKLACDNFGPGTCLFVVRRAGYGPSSWATRATLHFLGETFNDYRSAWRATSLTSVCLCLTFYSVL